MRNTAKIRMPRGGGKTKKAIEIANETGAYLVVHSYDEVKRISMAHHYIDSYPKPKREPITYDELVREGLRGSPVRNIVIDDMDYFINFLINRAAGHLKIDAVTYTEPVL